MAVIPDIKIIQTNGWARKMRESQIELLSSNKIKEIWNDNKNAYEHSNEQPKLFISIVASFTAYPLLQYLGGSLSYFGITSKFHLAPYNHITQLGHSQETVIPNQTNLLVLLWRIEDLFEEEIEQYVENEFDVHSSQPINNKIDILKQSISSLVNKDYQVIVGIPPFPYIPHLSNQEDKTIWQINKFYQYIKSNIIEFVNTFKHFLFLDMEVIQRNYGIKNYFDLRTWYLYKQPWRDGFWYSIAKSLAKLIYSINIHSIKCIILDCDGVLWGGTIGEDGIGGISLSDKYPGRIYKEVQKYLLELRRKGILLALLSKNNEKDVWEVFDKHDEMLLKRTHISAHSINWNPKYQGLDEIAKKLNIGIDSMVFIDDSQFEIDEMKNFRPQVFSLNVPSDLISYIHLFDNFIFFQAENKTLEDFNRAKMLSQETERQALLSLLTKEMFLEKLNLNLLVRIADDKYIERIVQLLNRTNQFNLTCRRYQMFEVSKMLCHPNYNIFIASAKDIYGDYGLIGVAIINKEKEIFNIDSFLLSCRVLNRGVEDAFMSVILSFAKNNNFKTCKAEYIPNPKNMPASNFLSRHNFILDKDNVWNLELSNFIAKPSHVNIELITM